MIKMIARLTLFGLAAVALVSPAGAEHHEGDTADAVDPRLGEQVNRICFSRSISGWKSLKGEDNVVLLRSGVREWHRVELMGGCRESLFRSALSIGIDSRPIGSCVSRGDAIIVEDTPGFTRRCVISRIYEWDEDATAEAENDETPEDE